MNIYDFDGTIFKGNSSFKFFMFCAFRNPKIIKYGFRYLTDVIKYKFRILNVEESKKNYCDFVVEIDDLDILINKFWNKNIVCFHNWFLESKSSDDIIITTSPEFLVKPICNKLGNYNVIGTVVDLKTGKMIGKICHGSEKLKRLGNINTNFDYYTDDIYADKSLIEKAESAYLVKRKTLKRIK